MVPITVRIQNWINRATLKIGHTRLGLSLAARLGRDLEPERWIFIVGCYNSGTTLLARILARHPEIGSLPAEGVFLTDVLPYPEQYSWTRMWMQCLTQVQLMPGELSEEQVRRIKCQWAVWYPNDTPNLLEKSVANVTRMLFLQTHFQPAYFIALVRNGYAVAEGIRRRANFERWPNPEYEDEYPIELCAKQWGVCDRLIRHQWSHLERKRKVYYEDLVGNPRRVMNQITNFLGLQSIDEDVLNQKWSFQEQNEPIRNMNPQSFERLTQSDLDQIEDAVGGNLQRHGYRRPGV